MEGGRVSQIIEKQRFIVQITYKNSKNAIKSCFYVFDRILQTWNDEDAEWIEPFRP